MNLCNSGHNEVCYKMRSTAGHIQYCPVCTMREELEERVEELETALAEAKLKGGVT